ncbi:MAG: TrbC/VirB2 family protein [Endomicrobia bacterium]|nr:TrbC/VirB2 family protein [Endomicrobiia bacterium]
MIKKMSLVIPTLIIFCICFSFAQYADTSGIGSALQNVINWLTKVLGAALVVIGMVITGIRMSMHDPEALKKGIWVIVGGLIIFLSSNILKLIQSFAG